MDLQSHTLDELLEMYVEAMIVLYDSKVTEEPKEVIKDNEKLLSDIERVIFAKRAILPPI